MSRRYLEDGEYRLNSELKKLRELVAEPNRSYAMGYRDHLELNNRKYRTIARRLGELRYMLLLLGNVDAKKATREDMENVIRLTNRSKMANISKRKSKMTLRAFYKYLFQSNTYPDVVSWIDLGKDDSHKLPEDMLTEDDIERLIGVCKNQRDKTLVALLWDTGMRVGELLNLKVRDVKLTDNVSFVMVSGKTGDRRVPITFSVPYLANYINNFRQNTLQDDPLLCTFKHNTISNTPMDYPNVRKLLSDLKIRAKLQKRLYAHLFRHSRATFYANSLTEQQAKLFFGWTGGSTMVGRYTHLSGRDIDNAILKANGLPNSNGEPIKPKLSIKECQKCHERNETTAKYCAKCGTPLDVNVVENSINFERTIEELRVIKEALALLMAKIDPETREKILKIVKN